MKILLTGNQGFIGSHLQELISREHDVHGVDIKNGYDLSDEKNLVYLDKDYDVIIHLAATNGTRLFYETPFDVAMNNTLPTINLIKKYRNTKTHFIFASTCEIFNGAVDSGLYSVPTDESVPVHFSDILNPRWSYSLPKALGENVLANSGMNWTIIRYFNVYGPRQKDHFIPEFVDRVKKGIYEIHGNDTRSFCYVDDAIDATSRLMGNPNALGKIVNIGNQTETDIYSVAKIILNLLGEDKELKCFPSPKGSVTRRCPDISLLKQLIDYEPKYTIQEGLEKTIRSLK